MRFGVASTRMNKICLIYFNMLLYFRGKNLNEIRIVPERWESNSKIIYVHSQKVLYIRIFVRSNS